MGEGAVHGCQTACSGISASAHINLSCLSVIDETSIQSNTSSEIEGFQ
jgi:hypothetical protein